MAEHGFNDCDVFEEHDDRTVTARKVVDTEPVQITRPSLTEDKSVTSRSQPVGTVTENKSLPADSFATSKPLPADSFATSKPLSEYTFATNKPLSENTFATNNPLSEDISVTSKPLSENTSVANRSLIAAAVRMMQEVSLDDALGGGGEEEESYDSYDDEYDRPMERWAPLGAAQDPDEPGPSAHYTDSSHVSSRERLALLEEEQEQLNSSLLALTSHFAQVQFRLKQIVDAGDGDEKECLLKELEEFAFKGIPDVRQAGSREREALQSEEEYSEKISAQREQQQQLIMQLKEQLEDLETFAYQTGHSELPTSKKMEKQDAIISQLRQKLDIDLQDFDKLSNEDLRKVVDRAVGQIVNPAKVKEKMVEQLKTQIVDLERFIEFLQGESEAPGPLGAKCHCTKTGAHASKLARPDALPSAKHQSYAAQAVDIMKKTLTVLQIFAISQFGCGGRDFQKNLLKRTTKANHWGDLRARLEVAVNKAISLQQQCEQAQPEDTDYASDCEDAPVIQCNQALTSAVRKELASALRDLLQHGLMEVGQSSSLVPFGCFSSRSRNQNSAASSAPKMMHAWDLFVRYYDMKHGKEFNETAQRKLTQSFGLEIVGGKPVTVKQRMVWVPPIGNSKPNNYVLKTLLGAVAEITQSHVPLKRSEDSQFKAFVCHALNHGSLVKWLRLLLRTASIVEFYYQPWSYVVRTGFDDALVSLDRLSKLRFTLPVDLAVRPFTSIKDAF